MDQFVGQRAGKAVVTAGLVWVGMAIAERFRRAKPLPLVIAAVLGLLLGVAVTGFHPVWSAGAGLGGALVAAVIAAFIFRKPARPVAVLARDDRLGLRNYVAAWYRMFDEETYAFTVLFENGVYWALFGADEGKAARVMLESGEMPRSRTEGAWHVGNIVSLEPTAKDGRIDVRVNYREPFYDESFDLHFNSADEWDDFRDQLEHRCKVACRPAKIRAGLWRDIETSVGATGIYAVLVGGFLWIEWNATHGPPFRKPAADFRLMAAVALAGLVALIAWIVVKAKKRTMIDAWTTN